MAKGVSPPAPPVAPARAAVAAAPRVAPHAPLTSAHGTPTPSPVQSKVSPKLPPAAAVAAMVAAATSIAPAPPAPAARPVAAPPPDDDGWDEEPTRVGDDEMPTGMLQTATNPQPDVRAIVKDAVDAALMPMLRSLMDLQRRIEQIEQRPAAPVATAASAAAPAPAPRQPDPFASAMARPLSSPPPAMPAPVARVAPAAPLAPAAPAAPAARSPYALPVGPSGPTLDIAAINRDVALDFDMPFNGARRRKRMAIGCVTIFVVSLGGLLAILLHSYMR